MHCWAGSVVGATEVVSQALIDRFMAADPVARKALLTDWFNSLA